MNKLGKVAVALAMAFSVGAAMAEEPLCLLKYLRTSGTQYVNLDYYPTPKTTVVYNFYVTDHTKAQQGHFGSWGGDFSFYSRVRAGNKHTWGYADVEPPEASTATEGRANGLWKIELNGTNKTFKLWKNGTRTHNISMTSVATKTASLPMYLFSVNHNGKAEPMELVAFYDMQIYEDGVLVRDLKPCWTKEYETAVYDALTKTIYRNAGTGSFIAGPRIGSVTGDVHLQPQGEGLDDTAAIIETLKTLGGGDTLYLDAGQWNVSSNITVPAGTILSGAGRDKTVVRYAGSGLYKGYLFKVADEATLKGMTLKGATTALSSTRDCLGPVFVNNAFGDPAIVENMTITGFFHTYENFYEGYSGAAIRADSAATVRGCIITNNQTSASGGRTGYYPGIAIRTTSAATLVEGCVIRKNKRTDGTENQYSAPLVALGGTVRNCLVADNTSQRVTGVYATGSARIVNCTVANNMCAGSSTLSVCAACYGSADVEFVNCLVTGNKGLDGTLAPTNSTATAKFSFLCTEEPLYRDAAHGDYYVFCGAPVNSGTNEDWMAMATDIVGTARIVDGQADIGCYENTGALWCQIEGSTAPAGAAPFAVSFTSLLMGIDREGLVYHWAFERTSGFDLEGTDCSAPTWVFGHGHHTVRLRVTNAAGESWDSLVTVAVSVNLGKTYLSKTSTPKYPYATPETAANDFDTILNEDLVGVGTEILVLPDTYTLEKTLDVSKGVRIVSTGGPAVTTFNRSFTDKVPLVKLSVKDSALCGFTLKGTTYRAVEVSEGTVSNCVFCNLSTAAGNNGTGGLALYLGNNATVVDCLFTNNVFTLSGAYSRHGGTVYASGKGILIDRCRFIRNKMGTTTATQNTSPRKGIALYLNGSGTVRNSLFAEQSTKGNWSRTGTDTNTCAAVALVGAGPSRIENCTIVSNLAEGVAMTGGVYCDNATDVTIENTILFGNHDAKGNATDLRVSATDPSKTKLVTSLVGVDPKFRRPAKGDYSIRPSSPARDAGTNADWMNGAVDLGGGPRIIGGQVDIGCYENNGHGFSILVR